MAAKWIPFDGTRQNKLPKEYQPVLVKLDTPVNEAGGVAMGYLRYAAGDKNSPNFICVAIGGQWNVTHWIDCLPKDFLETVPGWNWPKSTPPKGRKA